MTMNNYQEQAMTTCMESSNNVAYMFMNLVGEVGELAEKMSEHSTRPATKELKAISKFCAKYGAMAKEIRKNPSTLQSFEMRTGCERVRFADEEARNEMAKEAGDIEWQLSGLCTVMGWRLDEDVAQQNLDKLQSRQQRDQIDGDGDNR